jgi:Protein of unknown function (DUF3108)
LNQNKILKGEKISYNVHYGFIKAGEVIISVEPNLSIVDSHFCYKATIDGYTVGAVGLFASIHDKFTAYIDSAMFLSHKFVRDVQENNYTLLETTEFDRNSNQAYVSKRKDDNSFEMKSYGIKKNVQDVVSSYFKMRNMTFDTLRKNQILSFDVFFEDTTFIFRMKSLGSDKIKTKIGRKKSIVFAPILPKMNNSIFAEKDPIKVWITDDAFRIPLKIQVNTKYGAAEADIIRYEITK